MPGLNRHSGVVSYGIDNRNNKIAEPVMELIIGTDRSSYNQDKR